MAAAAAPANPMDQFLEVDLGIDNQGMRDKIRAAGFVSLDALVKKPTGFAHKACQSIRKSTTGPAASRDVTMTTEEKLAQLVLYSRLRYILQKPMAFVHATDDNLELVDDWYNQLEDDPPETSVANFTDSSNKKQWFESITGYLAIKKGKTSLCH